MPTPGRKKLKLLALKLAALAGALLVCFLALEASLRLFWRPATFRIDHRRYRPEPWPYSFRFTPDQTITVPIPEVEGGELKIELNHHGFRGPDIDDVARQRVRIVSIGDSFTFGWGLKDFTDQCVVGFVDAYHRLHPQADVGLAVVAEPGWGVSDYLFAYLEFARRVRPQLVIVGFFCGDDIASTGTIASIGAGRPPDKPWSQSRSWLHSATLDWIRAQIRGSPNLTKLVLALGVRPSSELIRFLRSEPPPIPDMWRETFTILGTLNAEVRRDGGRLVIISYPSLVQVFAHQQLDDARFDYRHIDERLAAFCREHDIVFVPFLPALIADGKLDLYFAKDRHLTPRGQRLCRDVLIEKLSPVLDELVSRSAGRPEAPPATGNR